MKLQSYKLPKILTTPEAPYLEVHHPPQEICGSAVLNHYQTQALWLVLGTVPEVHWQAEFLADEAEHRSSPKRND
jgi:hypothetical protein